MKTSFKLMPLDNSLNKLMVHCEKKTNKICIFINKKTMKYMKLTACLLNRWYSGTKSQINDVADDKAIKIGMRKYLPKFIIYFL